MLGLAPLLHTFGFKDTFSVQAAVLSTAFLGGTWTKSKVPLDCYSSIHPLFLYWSIYSHMHASIHLLIHQLCASKPSCLTSMHLYLVSVHFQVDPSTVKLLRATPP